MTTKIRFALAQLDFPVGDIEDNTQKVIDNAIKARDELKADLIIFPELTLTGYPPEDLLFRQDLFDRLDLALKKIQTELIGIDMLVGHPVKNVSGCYNAASFINSATMVTYYKTCLPNYAVFDEMRYFKPGNQPLVIDYRGLKLGILICEDLWHLGPLRRACAAGANLIVSLNASPFDLRKHEARLKMLTARAKKSKLAIIYVNCVSGQDDLIFDGDSLAIEANGHIHQCGPLFKEALTAIDVDLDAHTPKLSFPNQQNYIVPAVEQRIYDALVFGLKSYVEKNNFPRAILGLSGGIDSALTLAIAVDALGPERVEAVLMPSRYTSETSISDALEQAKRMQVRTRQISIEPALKAFLASLTNKFEQPIADLTEQNLQARCRGVILMAISNQEKGVVLSTGNKSEISVGYCTLYGDTAGGFCALKDVPKTLVYRLAAYRNGLSRVIPEQVITKPPTAELAVNQKDEDSLPPYAILDQILELYIENDCSLKDIVAKGFDQQVVKAVILLVDKNEYKRRQAAPGVKITQRAFGRDRRFPITSSFNTSLKAV